MGFRCPRRVTLSAVDTTKHFVSPTLQWSIEERVPCLWVCDLRGVACQPCTLFIPLYERVVHECAGVGTGRGRAGELCREGATDAQSLVFCPRPEQRCAQFRSLAGRCRRCQHRSPRNYKQYVDASGRRWHRAPLAGGWPRLPNVRSIYSLAWQSGWQGAGNDRGGSGGTRARGVAGGCRE